jgi:hypothetical protein
VIFPGGAGHVGVGEAALMGEELDDRDAALPVGLEAGHVRGHRVGEAEGAALGEDPHRAGGDDLGIGVQEPERLVARGCPRLEPRLAEGLEEGEPAASGHRDLGARITALGEMPRDDLGEALERPRIESERRRRGRREREGHGVSCPR